ncbi:MAG: hypothetical protein WBA05_14890, partial [Gordonia sp. (in: high G+C Gram-positive bacteria)]
MDSAAAAADAAEINRIIAAARAVAARLSAAFAPGELVGAAADGAAQAGARLAEQVSAAADGLVGGQSSLTGAAGILAATVAYRPRVLAMTIVLPRSAAAGAAARAALGAELTGAYNVPMAGSARGLTAVAAPPPGIGASAVGHGVDPVIGVGRSADVSVSDSATTPTVGVTSGVSASDAPGSAAPALEASGPDAKGESVITTPSGPGPAPAAPGGAPGAPGA